MVGDTVTPTDAPAAFEREQGLRSALARTIDRACTAGGWVSAFVLALFLRDLGLSCFGVLCALAGCGTVVLSIVWLFRRADSRWQFLNVAGLAALFALALWGPLPHWSFLLRRLAEFERVVAGDAELPADAISMSRVAGETVVSYHMWERWSDSYHIVFRHEEDVPDRTNGAWRAGLSDPEIFSSLRRSEATWHLWGPWYACIH